jgi:uncharacterized membrane protein
MRTRGRSLSIGPPAWPAVTLMLLVLGALGPGVPTAEARTDIYYIWRDGVRLAEGENPYAFDHAAESDERPTKHPSYLPLFYLVVAGLHRLGLHDYATWMRVWWGMRFTAHFAIAVLLFLAGQHSGCLLLGLLGALFWSFDRWTLYTFRAGGLDQLALLFLLLSLQCLVRRRRLAFLLFGVSLAIKHVGLLVTPLYLLWTWQRFAGGPEWARWRALGQAALWIALIPVLVSLPFLLWDASAFTQSIVSSVTRPADSRAYGSAIGTVLGLRGGVARIPLLLLLALIVLVAAHRQLIGRYMAVLLTFFAFTDFNPVLFPQYFVWIIPFIVLTAGELAEAPSRAVTGATS